MATAETHRGLVRAIRRWDLVAIVINGVIGAGIFGLPAKVFASTGVWSLAAFAACAAVVTLIILCFAEVSSRLQETGGPYLHAREAFGAAAGFEVGWLIWVTRVTAFAANVNLFADYLGGLAPEAGAGAWRIAVIVTVVGVLAAINFVGVRQAAVASNVFAVAKLAPLAIFIVAGLFVIDRSRLSPGPMPDLGAFSSSVLLLIYAFTGFEMATIPGGESKDPRRDVPQALLLSIAAVAAIYVLVQTVAIGTLPGLAASKWPIADAARQFLGHGGGVLICIGALVSIAGNLNTTMLVSARLPFAMAERRELPRILATTHPRFGTPHVSLLVTAAVILGIALSGTFIYAATLSVIARLLTYAATCASLFVFRRRPDAPRAAFRAPFGAAVAVAALALIAWLLAQVKLDEVRDTGVAVGVGLVMYAVARAKSKAG
jgi:APA family basic amino acid/polyamine antiporter